MGAVLSIGTSHPRNIAGIGLDIALGAQRGIEVVVVTAAVSAQGASGVHALHAIPLDILRSQVACIPWERIGAIRVGALPSGAHVGVVAELLAAHSSLLAVVDPVLFASSGGALGDRSVLPALCDQMLAQSNVLLTPNLAEAAALLGRVAIGRDEMEEGARALLGRGMRAVLLKGGHLEGEPCDLLTERVDGVDELPRGERFCAPRIAGAARGTGCTLAFGIAAALAQGATIRESVLAARALVRERIAHAS